MRAVIPFVLLCWVSVMLEQARPDLLPPGALLLPLVVIGMFWNRTASGVFVGGVLLVLDWIIRPQGVPLLPVALTFGATLLMTVGESRDVWSGRRRRWKIPDWIRPALLVCAGIGFLICPPLIAQHVTTAAAFSVLLKYTIISLPLSLLLTGLMKVAGEFGWRRLTW